MLRSLPKATDMRSRVSAFCLRRVIKGPSASCLLLQVIARARPRKAVTGKRPCLVGFCRFRPQLQSKARQPRQRPKTAETDQAPVGQAWEVKDDSNSKLCELCVLCGSRRLLPYCRTVSPKVFLGRKMLKPAKRKLPATSPPAGERRTLCSYNGCERSTDGLTLAAESGVETVAEDVREVVED